MGYSKKRIRSRKISAKSGADRDVKNGIVPAETYLFDATDAFQNSVNIHPEKDQMPESPVYAAATSRSYSRRKPLRPVKDKKVNILDWKAKIPKISLTTAISKNGRFAPTIAPGETSLADATEASGEDSHNSENIDPLNNHKPESPVSIRTSHRYESVRKPHTRLRDKNARMGKLGDRKRKPAAVQLSFKKGSQEPSGRTSSDVSTYWSSIQKDHSALIKATVGKPCVLVPCDSGVGMVQLGPRRANSVIHEMNEWKS